MIGAIVGDMAGSIYEFNPCKDKALLQSLPLLSDKIYFTDDTVMTIAIAYALFFGDPVLGNVVDKEDWDSQVFIDELATRKHDPEVLAEAVVASMQRFGQDYDGIGYGPHFAQWLWEPDPKPYNSFGNGSAMRVSPVGWFFDSLAEVEQYAKVTAAVTHDHPEGIKGAQSTAAAICLARTGASKEEIRAYIAETYGYDLHRTVDDIRPTYSFDVTCQGSVPEAIIAFLDSTDFEDTIINAISLGGDSDTQAAIAGSIAEAFYGVPESLSQQALELLNDDLRAVLELWELQILHK